jgi:hypothetical protein
MRQQGELELLLSVQLLTNLAAGDIPTSLLMLTVCSKSIAVTMNAPAEVLQLLLSKCFGGIRIIKHANRTGTVLNATATTNLAVGELYYTATDANGFKSITVTIMAH